MTSSRMYGKPGNLFFSSPPPYSDLCMVVITVPPLPKNTSNGAVVSNYQPQIIRCRELIYTEPDIIATPDLQAERQVKIVMQQSLFRTGRLQSRFRKLGHEMEKPRRVTPSEYQSCLNYTLLARLAPSWNKVGERLMKVMELNVTEEEMYLSLKGEMIKDCPIMLRDLEICRPIMNEFLMNRPDGMIEEYSIGKKWCHILPSMKKGQIINVLHSIPEDSPFKTYKDIKRYWKNTYGFRLPETDDGMLYYQVYFKLVGDILFTYPECCVRPHQPVTYNSVDQKPILKEFLGDLHTKVPKICGVPTSFTSDIKVPDVSLDYASQVATSLPNVSELPSRPAPRVSQLPPSVRKQWIPGAHPSMLNSLSQRQTQVFSTQEGDNTDIIGPSQPARTSFLNNIGSYHSVMEKEPERPKPSGPRIRPVFVAVKKKGAQNAQDTQQSTSSFTVNSTGRLVPSFGVSQPTNTPQPPSLPRPMKQTSHGNISLQSAGRGPSMPVSRSDDRLFRVEGDDNFELYHEEKRRLAAASAEAATTPRFSESLKRAMKSAGTEGTPKSKKPKSKPQVQNDVDIKLLAANNQLSKVNTATLIAWLKERGVPCRVKDKKAELVQKTMQHLGMNHLAIEQ